ncbi:MAG: PH domain-containing protein [Lachnospiraceae bacterium]|nr:PH domain-containing protein [Ruminococcus sp.]MCM1274233.1 PH domain-containing protein [Lachnospiraceae bacterium]
MNFILYYILRKLFIRLSFTESEIILEKGIILRRKTVLPLKSVVRVSSERPLLMRIFGAKKMLVFAVRGRITFYLKKTEELPFLPEIRSASVKPRFPEVLFGAFADTRALGGVTLLAAFLRKLGSLFGGEYFNKVTSAISDTAETLSNALSALHIAVPRITAVLAVLIPAAWSLAFARKLLRLANLRAARHGDLLRVQSGVITLYEHTLVLNSSAATISPLSTVLAKRAPVYVRGVMIYPAAPKAKAAKIIRALCNIPVDSGNGLKPPRSAFFGFCGAPFWWAVGFSAALALTYLSDSPAMLLKTVLYCGLTVSLYAIPLCLVYMGRSGLSVGKTSVKLSARRGLRLFTIYVPRRTIAESTLSQSIFQRRSDLCHFRLAAADRQKLTARHLLKREIPRCIPFR